MTRTHMAGLWRAAYPTVALVLVTGIACALLMHAGHGAKDAHVGIRPEARLAADVQRSAAWITSGHTPACASCTDCPLLRPPPLPVAIPVPVSNEVAVAAALQPPPAFVLTGVAGNGKRRYVRLNGCLYGVGDLVQPGIRVEQIGANYAVLVDKQGVRQTARLYTP